MKLKSYIIPAIVAAMLATPAWANNKQEPSSNITQQQAKVDKVKVLEDAVQALEKTNLALHQLEQGQKQDALDTLALVTGKLELLIAQHPDLALAPVDVQMIVQDYAGDEKSVKAIRKEAKKLLGDGQLQKARHLIRDVASEIVVRTVNLPLATYPGAIKAIVPLIQADKIVEAKAALQSSLSTVVMIDDIIPLPVLRAQNTLAAAESLAKKERSDEDNKTLQGLFQETRKQLEWAQTLGYGDEDSFEPFYDAIDNIEKAIARDEDQQGLFDKLRNRVEHLFKGSKG